MHDIWVGLVRQLITVPRQTEINLCLTTNCYLGHFGVLESNVYVPKDKWTLLYQPPKNLMCLLNFLYCPYLENPVYNYRIIQYNVVKGCTENAFSNNTKQRDFSPLLCWNASQQLNQRKIHSLYCYLLRLVHSLTSITFLSFNNHLFN